MRFNAHRCVLPYITVLIILEQNVRQNTNQKYQDKTINLIDTPGYISANFVFY